MPIQCVIFDLDGTLVDSLLDITVSLNHALQEVGLKPLSAAQTRSLVGEGISRLIEKALMAQGRPELKDKVAELFLQHYSVHLLDATRPYPGVAQTLQALRGFRKAVISNKRESLTERVLQGLGLRGHFDLVVGADTLPQKKPSPEPVLYVLKQLSLGPQEAILVGDSPYDIQAAHGAGLKCVAVSYGYRPREALAEADYLIERIGELLKVLYAYEPMMERRRAPRYEVPQEYHQLIRLGIQTEGGALPALLLDLSEGGVRLQCPRAFAPGSQLALELSAPRCLHHNATFSMEVRHCQELSPGAYVLGGAVLRKDQEMWFRVYQRMFEFIIRRKGILY
jgi:phosphoglycolate phosphatase